MLMVPLKQTIKKLSKDRRGNFALAAAIVAPLLLAGGGLAIDLANQTAMKTRLQAASDSVSLAVATRIADGNLAIADAENFATLLLEAQMANDYSRFSNLKIVPLIKITEVKNGGDSTWTVKVGGTATQSTTPFAAFLNKKTTSATVSSVSQSGKEEIQSALSMAIVVDVSGSMGWELPKTAASSNVSSSTNIDTTASVLNINIEQAEIILDKIKGVIDTHGLNYSELSFIVNKYKFSQCINMSNKKKKREEFFQAIGLPFDGDKSLARQICEDVAYATKTWISKGKYKKNFLNITGPLQPMVKIDALRDAAAALFAQFESVDENKKYVRTGLSAYSNKVKKTTKMEWGSDAAKNYTTGMKATGGTASTKSVQWAFDQLKSSNVTEKNAHIAKNGQTDADRFLLFMTDGDNNNGSDDTKTKAICDSAKSDGIDVFTVAFAAPTRGEKLLEYCASEPKSEHYFDPDTAAELIAAFKNIGAKTKPKRTRLTN